MKGFRTFLLRGNVVDLAVAVVIGTAFVQVVLQFTNAFITPLITLIVGKNSLAQLSFTVNGVVFPLYLFINAVFAFVIMAAVIYFLVVTPINALVQRARREPPADPTTKKCTECLSEIPIGAKRCAFCTQPQPA